MNTGVTGITCRYNETIHEFVMLNDISKTPAARGALEQMSYKLSRIHGMKKNNFKFPYSNYNSKSTRFRSLNYNYYFD
ncbi:hypothetical protein [Candidatus Nitrosocosmicus hydrocola]|uniref:hypothetical protein n=1 Tax=Candidatus Nitrosocosmicus hydrocola TaxID=1826872 RepID=UPI001372F41F|nr:hypothetical protein [Candidatus Nitrosocosmicus hydrocola]